MRASPVLLAVALSLGPSAPVSDAAGRCGRPDPNLPHWARGHRMTVLNDSVLLSGEPVLRRGFPCWRVKLIGRPALMLRDAEHEIRTSGRRVAPLAVVGIGYNSLWERGGRNHAKWAARFDSEAARLVRTLRRAGAEQIVWVTLRRANRATTAQSRWSELDQYSWYFPYVNDRLRRLDERRRDLVLAEWAHVGARPDVTYDTIHLNARGGRMMQRLIEKTIYDEAYAQVAGPLVATRTPGPAPPPGTRPPAR